MTLEPISLTGWTGADPRRWLLPVRYESRSASEPPVLVAWWQWCESAGASGLPGWKLMTRVTEAA